MAEPHRRRVALRERRRLVPRYREMQRRGERPHIRIAVGGLRRERAEHHSFQLWPDGRVVLAGRQRRLRQHERGDFVRCVRVMGHDPGEHFIQHRAERVDVCALINGATAQLLGRHVLRCSDGQTGGSQCAYRGALTEDFQLASDAEVGQHRSPLRVYEHVLWLDVAMHQALVVRGVQSGRYLHRQPRRLRGTNDPFAVDAVAQRLLEYRHDDVEQSALFAETEKRHNIRMVEGCHPTSLVAKPGHVSSILCEMPGQHLDRDLAGEPWIQSTVDLGHAATTQQGNELVASEHRSDQRSLGPLGNHVTPPAPSSMTGTS